MHRLVPGPFQGSLQPRTAAGQKQARALDLGCSLMAFAACVGVWIGAYSVNPAADIVVVVKISCLAFLALAVPGLLLLEMNAEAPRLAATMMAARVRGRLRGHGVWRLGRRRVASPPGVDEEVRAAVEAGRAQARETAFALIEEAATLGETASALEESTQALQRQGAQASDAMNLTESVVSAAADHAVALARAVRATTVQAQNATEVAIKLSDTAFNAQRSLAELDDKTAHLIVAADGIADLLRSAGGQAAQVEPAQQIATAVLRALDDIQGAVTGLRAQAGEVARRLGELDRQIQAQHQFGQALGHAVMQQGEEVGAILAKLTEAQSGFTLLRAGVEAVTRSGVGRASNAEALRATANRLPSHAEKIASMLRDIPDFASGLDL